MKKLLLLTAFALGAVLMGTEAKAQSNWELGVRFGNPTFAVDATIPLKAPRIHLAAYFENNFGIGGYFDWMFALNGSPTGLKFYPGVGPEFIFADEFQFNIAGDFGAEYSFEFPLTIGFDWRPHFETTNSFNFDAGNFGFIARFRFGEGVGFTKAN